MQNFIFVAEGAFIAMTVMAKLTPKAGLDPTAETEIT
jgi:hypothetical protein